MKLSKYHKNISSTKRISRICHFGDLGSGQFCDLPMDGMGQKPNPSYTHQVWLFYYELSDVKLLLMIQVQILVGGLHRGPLGSYDVIGSHQHVWASNSRLKRARGMGDHACIVTTHRRLMCNMTYLGLYLASGDLDLRPNIDLTCLRSPCIWFDAP